MKGLLIAGAGGHGMVVAETAQAMGVWGKIAFLDDRYDELYEVLSFPVLGRINSASDLKSEYSDIVVAIGDAETRLMYLEQFEREGFCLPSVIHPVAWLSPSVSLGVGCVVFAQSAVNAGAVLGHGVIVNTGATVDHNCKVDDGVHICPGVHLAGDVRVGKGSWIGIGASVLQQVVVGQHAMVGAGAMAVEDVPDDVTVVGVPARIHNMRKSTNIQLSPWPYYARDEIDAVTEVLRSGKVNYWTGENGRSFEREFSSFIGCKYGVAMANGTLALEAALHALGVGEGDEVIVPAKTFIATASSVVMCGAEPVVADIDLYSGNITVESIEAARTEKTAAIIVVHLCGWPCDMPAIMAYAAEHGLKVVEDCAQAHGAEIDGRKVGSFGHAAAFSFCQDKIITTGGEGGMLVTNDEAVWRSAWSLKDHGRDYDEVYHREHEPGQRWYCTSFGTNWRLTEMQSAIGRIQLQKLPAWLATRRYYATMLMDALSDVRGLTIPVPEAGLLHACYRVNGLIDLNVLGSDWNQNRIIETIVAEGVPCFHGVCSEIYREKAFEPMMRDSYPLPNAMLSGQRSMALLVHPTLKEEHIEKTIEVVRAVLQRAVG